MKRAVLLLVALAIVASGAAALVMPALYRRQLEPPPGSGSRLLLIQVKKGASASAIAAMLEDKRLIRNARAFVRLLRERDWTGRLQPGWYRVPAGQHAEVVARQLVDRDIWRIKVTIPEGLNLRQIAERIEKAGRLEGGQWLPSAGEIKAVATAEMLKRVTGIAIPTHYAEGYLFPDTYLVPAGASAFEVVAPMFEQFAARFIEPHRQELRRAGHSLHELVTLASIIEREAEADPERPLIAQVFLNRLRIGMKLESCATVQYALPQHKSRLLFRDLKVDSPYNTYIHRGLPPGPICSPGEPSLLAALRPQATDALFFVSRGDGTHVFSRTMAEHEQAIRQVRGG